MIWYSISSIFVNKGDEHSGIFLLSLKGGYSEVKVSGPHFILSLFLIMFFSFILSLVYHPDQPGTLNTVVGSYLYAQIKGSGIIMAASPIIAHIYATEYDYGVVQDFEKFCFNDLPRHLTKILFPLWFMYTVWCIVMGKTPQVVLEAYPFLFLLIHIIHYS